MRKAKHNQGNDHQGTIDKLRSALCFPFHKGDEIISDIGRENIRSWKRNMDDQEKANIGKRFPEVRAKSLAKFPVSIPEAAKNHITLIVVAFRQESQSQLDSWLVPFTEKYGTREGFTFFEIPMISSGYKIMRFVIDGGMRSGIPKNKHNHVVTMYGDTKRYKNELGLETRYGYAFLLDKEGVIQWQGRGTSTPESLKELFELAEKLDKTV
jgi:ATPase complex subunit ATP10